MCNDNIMRDYPLDSTPQTMGMNYFICGYCLAIGETITLNDAIQLANKYHDISDLRIIEYATKTAYYF